MIDIDEGAWDKTLRSEREGLLLDEPRGRHATFARATRPAPSSTSPASPASSPRRSRAVYAMTKAAIISMTKTLAYELAANNIRVERHRSGLRRHAFRGGRAQERRAARRSPPHDADEALRAAARNRRRRALSSPRIRRATSPGHTLVDRRRHDHRVIAVGRRRGAGSMQRGEVVAGKYRLNQLLGSGRHGRGLVGDEHLHRARSSPSSS